MVIGIDAGATATRCVVASLDGSVLSRATAGGANQRSSTGSPADTLLAALRPALSTVESREITAGVVGLAGAGSAGRAAAEAAVAAAWRAAGLSSPVHTVTDLEVAFAAGTARSNGLLLVAGTGAAAVALADGVIVHRCDGYGWLFGDEGSAVWIGLSALRSVLCALDGRGAPTALTEPISAHLLGSRPVPAVAGEHAQALIGAGYALAPAALGELAPLVAAAADSGDPVAGRIAEDAARRLLGALDAVARIAGPDGAIVLAGSVLLAPGPIADAVRAGARLRYDTDPAFARDGAAGAAALAIARATGAPLPPEVHARLLSSSASTGPAGSPRSDAT
jgi:N-acetylglucosamine kinase-like BadF-type ATPase